MIEFNIPDLLSSNMLRERDRYIVSNFIQVYNVNIIRNVIKNGSCSCMYSTKDLKFKYNKYIKSEYSKPKSKRATVIKKLIERLSNDTR